MQDEKPQPADEPKGEADAGEEPPVGEKPPVGEEAPPMNRAERRARKHKRKGELRKMHDRGNPLKSDSKGHLGRMYRRKSI